MHAFGGFLVDILIQYKDQRGDASAKVKETIIWLKNQNYICGCQWNQVSSFC